VSEDWQSVPMGDPSRRLGDAFAAEPGIEPAPQTAEAKLVDAAVTGWFRRYLT
jgi:hypothetical protein